MKRFFLTLIFVLSGALVCSAQTFYFPQIADGQAGGGISWKTSIFITNPAAAGTSTASGSITFTKSDGTAFNVSFVDSAGVPVGSGNTISFQIAGSQTRKFVSTAGGNLAVGYATVTSNVNVTGTAIFSQFSGTRLLSEAGVPSSSALARQAIFVDTVGGFNTGVAYANPSDAGATVTLRLLNSEGVSVVPSPARGDLLPNGHTAKFVSELFPTAAQTVGTLQIISSTPLASVALRFDPTFSLFTTLPPVSIASLLHPAVEWLEQRPWITPFTSLARLLGALQLRMG